MNELELTKYLKSDPLTRLKFRGVMSYDELCCFNDKSGIFVINLDVSTGPGTHWVCLFLGSEISEYFDSLGNPPLKLETFLMDRGCKYIYNTKKVQSDNSDVCGDYCILFSFFRCRGICFEDFLSFFSNDLMSNDEMIKL